MKRNTFMKRLAVTALAATMTFGTVPVTAVSALADTTAEDTKTTADAATTAVQNAVKDSTTDKAAYQKALDAVDDGNTYSVDSVATTPIAIDTSNPKKITFTKPKQDVTVSVSTKDPETGEVKSTKKIYTVEVKSLTNAEKLQVAQAVVRAAFSQDSFKQAAIKEFNAYDKINDATVKEAAEQALKDAADADVKDAVKDVKVAVEGTTLTESAEKTHGTLAGTVTLSVATADGKGTDTATINVADEKIEIPYTEAEAKDYIDAIVAKLNAATFTNQDVKDIKSGYETLIASPTDDKLDAITNFLKADENIDIPLRFQDQLKIVITKVTPAQHGQNGSIEGNVVLKGKHGDETALERFTSTLVHSSQDAYDEAVQKIQAAVKTVKASDIQADGATVAASDDDVKAAYAKAIDAALGDVKNEISGYTIDVTNDKADAQKNGTVSVKVSVTPAAPKGDGLDLVNGKYVPSDTVKAENPVATASVTLPFLKYVELKGISLGEDRKIQFNKHGDVLPYVATPADANYFTWTATSSDESVLTVTPSGDDGDELKVTPVTSGKSATVKITATDTKTGRVYRSSVTITVVKGFEDVQNTAAFYYDPVYRAANATVTDKDGNTVASPITTGIDDTHFGRNNEVTRGQFLTWLYKIATNYYDYDAIADGAETTQFSDVKADKFYAKAVTWAVENGITSGTTATTFSPNATITRAQAVTMMWRLAGSPEYNYNDAFSDVAANKWYANAVQWAVANDVTSGNTANTFNPNGTATRAQAITFLAKGFGIGWFTEKQTDTVKVDQ